MVIDDLTGPKWDVEESRSSVLEVLVEEYVEEYVDEEPSIEIDLRNDEDPPAPPAVASTPDADATEVVDRSDVLPPIEDDEPVSSLASLFGFGERQVSFVEQWQADVEVEDATAWETLPTLADVAIADGTSADTSNAVQRLWDATEDHSLVVDPIASPIEAPQSRLIDDRRFRRTAVIGGIFVVLLAAWGIRHVGDQPARDAIVRDSEFGTAAALIGESLTPVEQSLWVVTADISASSLARITTELDVLDGAGRSGAVLATEPLPQSNIVGSSLPIDALVLPQRLLEQASLQAMRIEQRIGDAISYRLTFAKAFDLPRLPTEAGLVEIWTIGGDLSVAIAASEQVLGQLPDDGFFAQHRQQAFDLLERIDQLQPSYFSALRNGDALEAAAIRDDIVRSIDQLRSGLAEPLSATEAWSLTQINQLHQVLAEIDQLAD